MEVGSVVSSMYNEAVTYAGSKSTVLISDGQDLAGVLILIVVSWAVLQWILTGDGVDALMDSFNSFARYFLVVVMLGSWGVIVGGFGQSLFTDLASKISGGSTIASASNTMVGAARNLFMDRKAKPPCIGDNSGAGDPEASLVNGSCIEVGRGAEPTVFDMLFNLPMVIVTLLLQLVGVVLLIIMMAAFLLMVFMSEAMFALALTFGPILVPWLIWKRTEWLFDGWLKFLISAIFVKLIAFWMVGFTAGIIKAVRTFANNVPVDSAVEYLGVNELAAFMIAVAAALGAFLMWQVPGLAQGLISGSAGVSGKGFGNNAASRAMRSFGSAGIKAIAGSGGGGKK